MALFRNRRRPMRGLWLLIPLAIAGSASAALFGLLPGAEEAGGAAPVTITATPQATVAEDDALLGVPLGGGSQTPCTMQPSQEYIAGNPAALGLDAAKLQSALDYAAVNGSSSIKVFRRGCLVGQGIRDPFQDRLPELNAGQTKTIVALVAGIVADKGWVDIDAPIGTYLPAGMGDAAHRAITLRQFMTLTSGIQVNHLNGLNFFLDQSRTGEYFETELTRPAGTYYEFDEITPSVVVYVLQRVIDQHRPGTDFQQFVQAELFNPLGIPTTAYFWQKDRSGTTTGYSGLFLRPLEYGRIGMLLLNRGRFGGRQIVSTNYVRKMKDGTTANCGFGLYLWLNSCRPGQSQVNTDYPSRRTYPGEAWVQSAPSDMVYSLGLGTNTFVIPSLDMVVTRAGYQELDVLSGVLNADVHGAFPGNAGGPGEHEFFRRLMASVTDIPVAVRATIQNSGPYDRAPDQRVDLAPFIVPVSAPLGSYAVVGPGAPSNCTALRCAGEPNDGLLWITQVPGTGLGILGIEQRPSG